MEAAPIALIAMLGGFALPLGIGLKTLLDLHQAWRVSRTDDDARYLHLVVNGKDFSVDLKTISNGGSETIHSARRELERCG